MHNRFIQLLGHMYHLYWNVCRRDICSLILKFKIENDERNSCDTGFTSITLYFIELHESNREWMTKRYNKLHESAF